jgi:hypothetical protein
MTDLVPYDRRTPATIDTKTDAYHRLGEWANSAQAAYSVAESLVKTSFVPESFRGKPYEATAAILAGLELGLDPMASLRSFDVIQGQAAPRAITLRAVAQAHGHELVVDESTNTRCVMRGRRAGSQDWQKVVWTMDRAKALGVTGKNNWKVQPQSMLVARATSELARLIAADAILGIGYSAEEIADGADVHDDSAVVVDDAPKTTRRRRSAPAALEAAAEDEPDEPPPPTDDKPSAAQTKMAMATFKDAGIEDRDDRLKATSAFVGHPVASWSELTRDEASTVIDALERLRAGHISFTVADDGTWTTVETDDSNLFGDDQ